MGGEAFAEAPDFARQYEFQASSPAWAVVVGH
jgi:hypothetical protein